MSRRIASTAGCATRHIAGLGSIPLDPTPLDRFEFWRDLHQRLARLANRLNDETRYRILGAIAERVPMLTVEEQTASQVETARAEAGRWRALEGMKAATGAEHQQLADKAAAAAKDLRERASEAAEAAAQAETLVGRIERGETSGPVRRPTTREELLKSMGFSPVEMRWIDFVGSLPKDLFEATLAEEREDILAGRHLASERARFRRALLAVLARRQLA